MKITCHMISSVDGKLLPEFWSPLASEKATIEQVYEDAAKQFDAQGFIVGRKALVHCFKGIEEREPLQGPRTPQTNSFEGDYKGRKLCVVFDETGRLHYSSPNLPTGEHIVAVLGSHVTRAYQKELEDVGVSYVMRLPGNPKEETKDALRLIEKHFGVTHLLLEGGGITNGRFFQRGLVDQLSVVIYPGIDGKSGRPSIIECKEEAYDKPLENNKLELTECKNLGEGFVQVVYNVQHI